MFKNPHKRIYLAIFISTLPFLWLFTQVNIVGGWLNAFANISGFIGAILMLWQFLLGIRFIAVQIDTHYVWINKLHKRLGKYGSIFVLIHPVLQIVPYGVELFYSMDLSSQFMRGVIFGRTAFYLYLAIFVTSVLYRKKLKYRPWLYIHYLSYPLLFFVFLHAKTIGTFFNTFPMISIYWNILTFIFYILVIFRLGMYLNFFKQKFVLTSKKKISSDISIYELKKIGKFKSPKPGQNYYIRPSFFGESHPYSVMEIKEDKKIITFGIKAVGPHSRKMEKVKEGSTLYLDGPYGRFTEEGHNKKPKIILAGGIGVTPFVELVKRYGDEGTYMFNSNKNLNDAAARKVLKDKLGDRYVDVITQQKVSDKNIENSRLNVDMIKKYVPDNIIKNAKVFVCGSPGFMNACQKFADELGIDKKNIYTEEFSL